MSYSPNAATPKPKPDRIYGFNLDEYLADDMDEHIADNMRAWRIQVQKQQG